MRLFALMNFYDESPTWLSATITSLTRLGVDHLIALDGAYPLYDGHERSGAEQAEAIHLACDAAGIGLTLERPGDNAPRRDEIQKRDYMFRQLNLIADPFADWAFVIDADEVVTKADRMELHSELQTCDEHVAACFTWYRTDVYDEQMRGNSPMSWRIYMGFDVDTALTSMQSRFFRVLPEMHVEQNHYGFTGLDPEGTRIYLRGDIGGMQYPKAGVRQLTAGVYLEHRDLYRTKHRHALKHDYYNRRDDLGIEST